jgi:hypothetical protein
MDVRLSLVIDVRGGAEAESILYVQLLVRFRVLQYEQ